jgi:ribosomal protein S18 acetylase RimI-like enzyme
MDAAIALARGREGDWAILQVRQDNDEARRIYERLGFVGLYSTVEMERAEGADFYDPPAELPAGYRVLPWRADDWRRVYDLALATTGDMERWVRGVDVGDFRRPLLRRLSESLGDILSGGRVWRVAVERDQALAGALLTRWRGEEGEGSINFCVRPACRGDIEPWLIQHALAQLGWRAGRLLRADHSAEHTAGVAALAAAGFREKRTLLTMRMRL